MCGLLSLLQQPAFSSAGSSLPRKDQTGYHGWPSAAGWSPQSDLRGVKRYHSEGGSLGEAPKGGAERTKSPHANTRWNRPFSETRERDRRGGRSGRKRVRKTNLTRKRRMNRPPRSPWSGPQETDRRFRSDECLCNLRPESADLLETNTNIYTRAAHLRVIARGRFMAAALTSRLTLLWLWAFTTEPHSRPGSDQNRFLPNNERRSARRCRFGSRTDANPNPDSQNRHVRWLQEECVSCSYFL